MKIKIVIPDYQVRQIVEAFGDFLEDHGVIDDEVTIVEEALADTLECMVEDMVLEYEHGRDSFEIDGRLFTQHLEERCAAWRENRARKAG